MNQPPPEPPRQGAVAFDLTPIGRRRGRRIDPAWVILALVAVLVAAAILHPRLGKPLRAAVEKGAALVPSAKKMGGLGSAVDVPLGHKDAAFVRSHFDAIEIRIPDAPRADEIVVAVAVTDSGRPLARVGGLQKNEIKGEDGLR